MADFHVSSNEVKGSATTKISLSENKGNPLLPFSKKHKISLDKSVEPENKRINIGETNISLPNQEENVLKNQENLMSEFKNLLFGSADRINSKKNQNMESTFMKNAVTNLSSMHNDMQQMGLEEKLCDLTNLEIPSQSKSDKLTISKTIDNDFNFKKRFVLGKNNSFDLENQMGFLIDASKVEVLPISLSDVPLEENKENIFVDVKNKNVLVTNARDLKLKEKLPLKASQVSKPLSVERQIKEYSYSVNKLLQRSEKCNPIYISEKDILCKQTKKSFVNKTCMLNHSMDLTCFPSDNDLTNKLEISTNDDYIQIIGDQSDKTRMDTSNFMDLTCNVQNLTGSLSSIISNSCDEKRQYIMNLSSELTENNFDKNLDKTGDIMEITCNVHNISDNLLMSTETNGIKELNAPYIEFSSYEKGVNEYVDRCSQTKYFSSCRMELTCDLKDKTNLSICKEASEHPDLESQPVNVSLSNNVVNDFNKEVNQYKGISEDSFVHSCAQNLLTNHVILESEKENFSSSQDNGNMLSMCDEMELTCYEKNISSEYFENSIPNVSLDKTKPAENQTESEILPNMTLISNVNSKSLASNRTRHFTSDDMELTSGICSDETQFKKNVSAKSFTKTKHFSLFSMDLTCSSVSEKEVISISSTVNSKGSSSNIPDEANQIDKNSDNIDVNIKDYATLQDNLEQNNTCPVNPFEKIHSLRKKIMETSESENCLWCLREMSGEEAVFEILGDSAFACYLMRVELDTTPEIPLCTQMAFIHLKEDPDDIDELGFSLFQSLVMNYIERLPFPVHELLDKLPTFVSFAKSARCLIKDVWFAAVKHEISIDDLSQTPKLNIKVLNENHFSYFNVCLPINLASYPNEKMIPEVTHLEHNVIKNEIIDVAIKKIHPGEKYLFRISEAANDL